MSEEQEIAICEGCKKAWCDCGKTQKDEDEVPREW